MPTVACSVGLTPDQWEKTRRYKINRSAIARRAIEDEIKRIETGDIPAKSAAGARANVHPPARQEDVSS